MLDLPDDIIVDIFHHIHAPCSFIGPRCLRELVDVFALGLTCNRLQQLAKEAFRSEFHTLDTCYPGRHESFAVYFPQYSNYPSLEHVPLFCSTDLRVVRVSASVKPLAFHRLLQNIATHCQNVTELSFSDGMLININHKIILSKLESLQRLEVSSPSKILLQMLGAILPKLAHLRLRNVSYQSLKPLQECLAWRARSRHYNPAFQPLRTISLKMRTSTRPIVMSSLNAFATYLQIHGREDLVSLWSFALWVEYLSPEDTRSLVGLLKRPDGAFAFGGNANVDLHIGHYRPLRFAVRVPRTPPLFDTFVRAHVWKLRRGPLQQAVVPVLQTGQVVLANGLAANYYHQRVQARKTECVTEAMRTACRATKMIVFPRIEPANGRLNLVLGFCADLLGNVKSLDNVIVSIEYLRYLIRQTEKNELSAFFRACSKVRAIRIREREKNTENIEMSSRVQDTIRLLVQVVRMVGKYCPNLECLNVRLPIVANNWRFSTINSRLTFSWEVENIERKCRRLDVESLRELANLSGGNTLNTELLEEVCHAY